MIQLNEEQKLILETVKTLAQEKIRPRAAEIDETGEFPWDTVRLLSDHGVLTPLLPERYGGIECEYLLFCMIIEEIARVCASSALLLIAQADGMLPLLCRGSEELKNAHLPGLARGKLAAFAATEPGAGSDILAMTTRAVRDGGDYVLNGQKCFITNGAVADVLTVFAYTEPDKGSKGISAFVVEKGAEGFTCGKNENKMGMRGSVNSQLFFDNVRVPERNRVGHEGEGVPNMMATLDTSRLFAAAQAVGLAQGAVDEVLSYISQRVQFGRPIAQIQAIQMMLADMAAGVEAARLLTYQAARYMDREDWSRISRFCAMAKFTASDMAMRVTTDAVQALGGYGYMKDFPVERMMRDAKLIQIYTGTNQIMRVVAARDLIRGHASGVGRHGISP